VCRICTVRRVVRRILGGARRVVRRAARRTVDCVGGRVERIDAARMEDDHFVIEVIQITDLNCSGRNYRTQT
jgi:hypothetical protein